jgi:hypothetical protein
MLASGSIPSYQVLLVGIEVALSRLPRAMQLNQDAKCWLWLSFYTTRDAKNGCMVARERVDRILADLGVDAELAWFWPCF